MSAVGNLRSYSQHTTFSGKNPFPQAMIDENFLSAALILAKEELDVGDFVNLTGGP